MATPRRRQLGTARRRGKKKQEARLHLDPDVWGMLAGAFVATTILALDYFQDPATPLGFHIVIGAGFAFVVSYLVAALFVWYVRLVKERELEEALLRARRHAAEEATNAAAAQGPPAGEG